MKLSGNQYDRLLRYSYKITKDPNIAADILHDAFIYFRENSNQLSKLRKDSINKLLPMYIRQAFYKSLRNKEKIEYPEELPDIQVCYQPEFEYQDLAKKIQEVKGHAYTEKRFTQSVVKIRDKIENKRPWNIKKMYRFV